MKDFNRCVIEMTPVMLDDNGIPATNGPDYLFLFKDSREDSRVWIVEEYYTPWFEWEINLDSREKYFWIVKEIK